MLSRDDIKKALVEGHLKIYPFEKKNLTGIGYNLSTTNFAFSINQGILLTIHYQTTQSGIIRYIIIPENDTVLFFSKEYIEIDQTLAGTFHSKVARVCQGLGHNSTTLDPTWKGQLIISVNNPTSQKIKFDLDKDSGNIMTLLLHSLDSEVTGHDIHDNNKGRCELLLAHFSEPSSNPKYRGKHLELKEFVVNELADSLNGYDCFIGAEQPNDQHSQKVQHLLELRDRFEREDTILMEDRYILGDHGKYFCFKKPEEFTLLKNCSLFEFMEQLNMIPKYPPDSQKSDLPNVNELLRKYIHIINYELDMIDHIRRIKWQNEKIEQFAGQDSELVKLRKRDEHKRRCIRFFPLIAIFAITAISIYILLAMNVSSVVWTVFSTICAPLLTFLVQLWYKFWKKPSKVSGKHR